MFGGIGVGAAAFYYIMMLRNADRERRKQMILQKLPTMSVEYYETYLNIDWNIYFETPEEFDKKYSSNLDIVPKIWHIINIYNTLGILYQEGLMGIDDVAKLYSPTWIILWYERFSFMFKRYRLDGKEGALYPELMVPFENLSLDLKQKYPGVERLIDLYKAERRRRYLEKNLESTK